MHRRRRPQVASRKRRALLVPINGWNYSDKVDLWLTVPSFAIAGRLPAASIFRGPLRQVARYRPVRAGKRLPRVRLGRGADGGRAHGAAPGASGEIDVISRGRSRRRASSLRPRPGAHEGRGGGSGQLEEFLRRFQIAGQAAVWFNHDLVPWAYSVDFTVPRNPRRGQQSGAATPCPRCA